jgi:hypothetical protein
MADKRKRTDGDAAPAPKRARGEDAFDRGGCSGDEVTFDEKVAAWESSRV